MAANAISKLRQFLQNPDSRASLAAVLDEDILVQLPYILRTAKNSLPYPFTKGGDAAARELFELIDHRDDPDTVKSIFGEGACSVNSFLPCSIDDEFHDGWEIVRYPVLHVAIIEHRPQVVKFCLGLPDLDINLLGGQTKDTVLHSAIKGYCNHLESEIVKMLLQRSDLDINKKNSKGECALFLAAKFDYNEGEIEDMLLADPRIDMNSVNRGRTSPLHLHAESRNRAGLQKWFAIPNIDVNFRDANGNTPLQTCLVIDPLDDWDLDDVLTVFDCLLADERTTLSCRDKDGKTIKDLAESEIPKMNREFHESKTAGREHEVFEMIERHEKDRLQRAKHQVKILSQWTVNTAPTDQQQAEQYLPEDVLSNYILPYVADVISPLEDIGGVLLQ